MSLRQAAEYQALAAELRRLSGTRRLVYARNPGNWGDALIHAGTMAFFRHFGIDVVEYRFGRVLKWKHRILISALHVPRPAFVYGGGGALTADYRQRVEEVADVFRWFGRGAILPSTIGVADLEPRLAAGVMLWRRDRAGSAAAAQSGRFCHDMAFFLQPSNRLPVEERGNFFRRDTEAVAGAPVPPDNHDISADGNDLSDPSGFLDGIGRYRTILTDRLHVAIAGALLGREVHLWPNSTFKNRAVFESSLEPFYPGVTFHPDRADIGIRTGGR